MKGSVMVVNGKLPSTMLTRVGAQSAGDKVAYLQAGDTARSYLIVVRLAKAVGVPVGLMWAYRSYAWQVAVKKQWTDRGRPQMAATPGTSNHGLARAIDVLQMQRKTDKHYGFLSKLLTCYGWTLGPNETRLGEWWHRDFHGIPTRKTLRVGSAGRDVWLWQLYLQGRGFKISKDSLFGFGTRKATIATQRSLFPGQPREWDGQVGPKTWAKAGL